VRNVSFPIHTQSISSLLDINTLSYRIYQYPPSFSSQSINTMTAPDCRESNSSILVFPEHASFQGTSWSNFPSTAKAQQDQTPQKPMRGKTRRRNSMIETKVWGCTGTTDVFGSDVLATDPWEEFTDEFKITGKNIDVSVRTSGTMSDSSEDEEQEQDQEQVSPEIPGSKDEQGEEGTMPLRDHRQEKAARKAARATARGRKGPSKGHRVLTKEEVGSKRRNRSRSKPSFAGPRRGRSLSIPKKEENFLDQPPSSSRSSETKQRTPRISLTRQSSAPQSATSKSRSRSPHSSLSRRSSRPESPTNKDQPPSSPRSNTPRISLSRQSSAPQSPTSKSRSKSPHTSLSRKASRPESPTNKDQSPSSPRNNSETKKRSPRTTRKPSRPSLSRQSSAPQSPTSKNRSKSPHASRKSIRPESPTNKDQPPLSPRSSETKQRSPRTTLSRQSSAPESPTSKNRSRSPHTSRKSSRPESPTTKSRSRSRGALKKNSGEDNEEDFSKSLPVCDLQDADRTRKTRGVEDKVRKTHSDKSRKMPVVEKSRKTQGKDKAPKTPSRMTPVEEKPQKTHVEEKSRNTQGEDKAPKIPSQKTPVEEKSIKTTSGEDNAVKTPTRKSKSLANPLDAGAVRKQGMSLFASPLPPKSYLSRGVQKRCKAGVKTQINQRKSNIKDSMADLLSDDSFHSARTSPERRMRSTSAGRRERSLTPEGDQSFCSAPVKNQSEHNTRTRPRRPRRHSMISGSTSQVRNSYPDTKDLIARPKSADSLVYKKSSPVSRMLRRNPSMELKKKMRNHVFENQGTKNKIFTASDDETEEIALL